MRDRFLRLVAALAALPLQLAAAQGGRPDELMTVEPAAKHVRFQLAAGSEAANDGLNFNGFTDGALTLTVPVGWRVEIAFINRDRGHPHGLAVVRPEAAFAGGELSPAFRGAATTPLRAGLPVVQAARLSFTASSAGEYYLICPVRDHAREGMWIRFVVSEDLSSPVVHATR